MRVKGLKIKPLFHEDMRDKLNWKEIIVDLSNGMKFKVDISTYTRAFEVVQRIGQEIKIKHIYDFRLFKITDKETRYLEDDEIVCDTYLVDRNKKKSKSLMDMFSSNNDNDEPPKIQF